MFPWPAAWQLRTILARGQMLGVQVTRVPDVRSSTWATTQASNDGSEIRVQIVMGVRLSLETFNVLSARAFLLG